MQIATREAPAEGGAPSLGLVERRDGEGTNARGRSDDPFAPRQIPPAFVPRSSKASRGSRQLRWTLVAGDLAALVLAWPAFFATAGDPLGSRRVDVRVVAAITLATLAGVVYASARGLYRSRVCSIKGQERLRLVGVAVASASVGAIVLNAFEVEVTLYAVAAQFACSWALLLLARSQYRAWLNSRRRRGEFVRPTLLIGGNEEAQYWSRLIADHPELGIELRGVIADTPQSVENLEVPWLGPYSQVVPLAHAMGATGVIAMVSALSIGELQSLKRQVELAGLHLQVSTGVLGVAPDRFTKTTLAHENLLYLERPSKLARSAALKRALDLVVAGSGLLIASPILLVAALAIRHEDGGPIFFHQMRVGREGRLFRLHKLRSMVPDAEAMKARIAEQNARKGPLFKAVADPRITRIGRILRATSIDEIPQLWNVLRGEMSLVGPRPALPEEVEQFDLELLARHSVQPGVTGLWQVEGREAASFNSYKQLDLHYVENWSILLDLTIIVETLGSLIGRTLRTLFKFRKDGEIAA